MGKSECISLVFPAATISRAPATPLAHNRPATLTYLRTWDTTLAHLRHHSHTTAPSLPRIRAITLTYLRLRRCAPTTPLSRIYAYAAAHLRNHSRASAPPHSRTFVLHLYTLAPPIAHLRPPLPLSELIRINQNLSELIRYPPRNFDGS